MQGPNSNKVPTRDHFQIKFKLQGPKTYFFFSFCEKRWLGRHKFLKKKLNST